MTRFQDKVKKKQVEVEGLIDGKEMGNNTMIKLVISFTGVYYHNRKQIRKHTKGSAH